MPVIQGLFMNNKNLSESDLCDKVTADDPVNPPELASTDATSGLPTDPLDAALQAQGALGPFARGSEPPKKYLLGGLVTVAVVLKQALYASV